MQDAATIPTKTCRAIQGTVVRPASGRRSLTHSPVADTLAEVARLVHPLMLLWEPVAEIPWRRADAW